jgi:hypothetical protein
MPKEQPKLCGHAEAFLQAYTGRANSRSTLPVTSSQEHGAAHNNASTKPSTIKCNKEDTQ